jgi:hypothetical protein
MAPSKNPLSWWPTVPNLKPPPANLIDEYRELVHILHTAGWVIIICLLSIAGLILGLLLLIRICLVFDRRVQARGECGRREDRLLRACEARGRMVLERKRLAREAGHQTREDSLWTMAMDTRNKFVGLVDSGRDLGLGAGSGATNNYYDLGSRQTSPLPSARRAPTGGKENERPGSSVGVLGPSLPDQEVNEENLWNQATVPPRKKSSSTSAAERPRDIVAARALDHRNRRRIRHLLQTGFSFEVASASEDTTRNHPN